MLSSDIYIYIYLDSRFVVRQVKKVVKCDLSCSVLNSFGLETSRLVTKKQYSTNTHTGLINSSTDVTDLYKLAETANSEYLSRKKNITKENIMEILVTKCLLIMF